MFVSLTLNFIFSVVTIHNYFHDNDNKNINDNKMEKMFCQPKINVKNNLHGHD